MSSRTKAKRAVLLSAVMSVCLCAPAVERVSVLRTGRSALVRCSFSEKEDLIVQVRDLANEWAYLVPKGLPTADFAKGTLIHAGGDDFTATHLGDFGFLSGNHGSSFVGTHTAAGHGLTADAVGSVAVHESGDRFVVVAVPDADHIVLHPEGRPGKDPRFAYRGKGRFTCGDKSWSSTAAVRGQLYPMNRFRRFSWKTADGKAVPDGCEVVSTHVDLEIEHDVLDPRGVLDYLKAHPGKTGCPFGTAWEQALCDTPEDAAANGDLLRLPALMTEKTTYSFDGFCCRLARRETTFRAPLDSVNILGLCYCWSPKEYLDTLFYIPRTRRLTLKDCAGKPIVSCDFTAGEKMPNPPWDANGYLTRADTTDPKNPPDRFVRTFTHKGRRIGVSLGYSLIDGVSALGKGWPNHPLVYYFWGTGKMYPQVMNLRDVQSGTTYVHTGYTQYFNPSREPDATSFYCHREGDSLLVYLDFHKSLEGKRIALPEEVVGRSFAILEKTPSVTVRSGETVPQEGLLLDVSDGYGTLVLRIDVSSCAN